MSERVSKEALALFADPQWIREGCTAQMWTAHLMALELTERREQERWMEDELASIAETAQPVDDEDTGLRSYMVINIRRIIEADQEKWLKLIQRVRDRKFLHEPPDA